MLNYQSRRRKKVTVGRKEAVQQLRMQHRVKHKKFIVMVLMLSFLSKKLPYQKMLREKRNVSRLSRIIMVDHNKTIMPRSPQLPTTLQLSLMPIRLRRMKMDTYSKLMKRETRPGASISQVAGPVSTTQVNHPSKRLNCSQMVPW